MGDKGGKKDKAKNKTQMTKKHEQQDKKKKNKQPIGFSNKKKLK